MAGKCVCRDEAVSGRNGQETKLTIACIVKRFTYIPMQKNGASNTFTECCSSSVLTCTRMSSKLAHTYIQAAKEGTLNSSIFHCLIHVCASYFSVSTQKRNKAYMVAVGIEAKVNFKCMLNTHKILSIVIYEQ